MKPDKIRVQEIAEVSLETADIISLYFKDEICSKSTPGQYVMIWIPEVDEVPMSISTIDFNGFSSVTIRPVGDATKALCKLVKGDRIGVRGPFGNGYSIKGVSPLFVAGGIGVASLTPLAMSFVKKGIIPTFVLGAKTESELVFRDRLHELLGNNLILATDDGTCGFEGFGSDCAFKQMDVKSFDHVYTCGPELMMASVFKKADSKRIPVQASLERYVKCAVGLCGSCAIGPYRVCKDGPVFKSEQLRLVVDEFGTKRMDPSGRYIKVDH
jgi:dihydroorotate dehydrogenase electron transfer subunit